MIDLAQPDLVQPLLGAHQLFKFDNAEARDREAALRVLHDHAFADETVQRLADRPLAGPVLLRHFPQDKLFARGQIGAQDIFANSRVDIEGQRLALARGAFCRGVFFSPIGLFCSAHCLPPQGSKSGIP